MIGSFSLVIAYLGISAINAEELLTGKLVATGNTREEVGLSSVGTGLSEYDVEEVKVIDRINSSVGLLVIMIIKKFNYDIYFGNQSYLFLL